MRLYLRYVVLGLSLVISTAFVVVSNSSFDQQVAQAAGSFTATFDGAPSAPNPFRPAGWDVSIISHEDDTIDGMMAEHGPACEKPDERWTPGTPPRAGANHFVQTVPFSCSSAPII